MRQYVGRHRRGRTCGFICPLRNEAGHPTCKWSKGHTGFHLSILRGDDEDITVTWPAMPSRILPLATLHFPKGRHNVWRAAS